MKKTFHKNAHFAHTDQLLLSMCANEDMKIRKNAVLKIRKIRMENQSMEKSIERSDDEKEDPAPTINNDSLTYSDGEEKSEGGYVKDDVSFVRKQEKWCLPN